MRPWTPSTRRSAPARASTSHGWTRFQDHRAGALGPVAELAGAETARAHRLGRLTPGRIRARWVLLGLVACSAGLRLLGALQVPSPWFTPDEQTYAALGRSLYHTGRYEILGRPAELLSLLYPAFAGIPLVAADATAGYVALKVLQAIVMSLTAVPVYLWARSLASERRALGAAVLSLAIPGLAFSGFVMTEVLFYPVLVLCAWAMASALAHPTLANQGWLVASVLLALGVRLQAVVLIPVLVLAIGLQLLFERAPLRSALRFAPALGSLAFVVVAWIVYRLAAGGGAGDILGAYQTTGKTAYGFADAVRFTLYHAADLLLLTALVPVAVVAVLVGRACAGREDSAAARAYLAVATALTLGFVSEIGLFTSRLLGRLGERYLIGLAPVFFVGVALWLERGAPRPRIAVLATSVAAVLLLLYFPVGRLVTEAAEPDAFTIIPLYQLRTRFPGVDVRLVLVLGAVALLALLVLLPTRLAWIAPALSLVLLVGASVSATRVVAAQASGFKRLMLGPDARWIDRAARGPVSFVYAGEYPWAGGGQVWASLFWNSRVDRVYDLGADRVDGLIPQFRIAPARDGRLLTSGLQVPGGQIVASNELTFFGTLIDSRGIFSLWSVGSPARLSTRTSGVRLPTGDVDGRARVKVYDCRGGALNVSVVAPQDQRLDVLRNGALYRRVALRAGLPWNGSVPAPTSAGGICTFDLLSGGGFHAAQLDFVRPTG